MDIVQALERELKRAKKQVKALGEALAAFGGTLSKSQQTGKKKRRMSVAARKKISQAQKARWAKQKAKA